MNKRIKKLWVNALRSGKYRQAVGELRNRNGDKYCCLGVLCDVYRKVEHKGRWLRTSDGDWFFLGEQALLPERVIEWADLPDDNPSVGRANNLAGLNDSGKSFDFIAGIIERYF